MKVYEAVGKTLIANGVEAVFGLMGDGNLRYVSHLAGPLGLPFYGTRHENTAIAMAEGYARASRQIGICSVTQGPGVTNALTALTAAVKSSTPLLLLTGETPGSIPEHIQGVDQQGLFEACGVAFHRFRGPDRVVGDLTNALWRTRREGRPVAFAIPTDQQEAETDEVPDLTMREPGVAQPLKPADTSVSRIAERLGNARRPVILAGRGVLVSDARDAIVELADRVGALLATTVAAKGLFSGHAFDIGICGGFSDKTARKLINESDLILAVGAQLNYWTNGHGELFGRSAAIVHCDHDPNAIGAYTPVADQVIGDAAETIRALLARVGNEDDAAVGYRTEAVTAALKKQDREGDIVDESTEDAIDPRTLAIALNRMLPEDRTISVDGGHFTGFPSMYVDVPDPTGFLFAVNFGAVGLGLGNAMGGGVARPDRLAVAFLGDGGALMTLGDIETAVRYRLQLLIVVFNDSAYGAEYHHLSLLGMPATESEFDDVDLAAAARGLGANALTVRSVKDLERLSGWLARPEGPFLLDCKVSRAVRAQWLEDAVMPQVRAREKAAKA